ncbi:MAG: prepilin-type N-terminal cleavage/methylation domain-containing protein [Phycisphaeraceae bacterium]
MRQAKRWASGFTMVEVVMAMMVISLMFVAALNAVGSSRTTLTTMGERARAMALAEGLMQEILAQPYADPQDADAFGPTATEAATEDRSLFDDVDDYDGWSASPPVDRDGVALSGNDDFERRAAVHWVQAETLGEAAAETGVKQITVTVSRGGKRMAELVALRVDAKPAEVQP